MNILLVYPKFPDTFWGFKYALPFISKKASFPPLGLLTVAALLPGAWNKKLVDMNIQELTECDILWSDYVFISAMSIQSVSVGHVIEQCKRLHAPIVAGGPLFTSAPEYYDRVDHLVLNEAEITLPQFIADLYRGTLRHLYRTTVWADIAETPLPLWEPMQMKKYSSMNIQYSRGCPYDCDFCDITVLYGRKPRTKTAQQIINELEALYTIGWRGPVFFVDDNFIGNKGKLKKETLPAIIDWMVKRKNSFVFNTEASLNLADDEPLLDLMVKAGFDSVFIGIESPNEQSLAECNKSQNRNRNMLESVRKIQRAGLEVQGGFIVGFDSDQPGIFDELIDFIQESGIVTAMVGLLNAPKGTALHQRLLGEGRLLTDFTGNNTDFSMNFIPRMDSAKLLDGYKKIVQTIYTPKLFYRRVKRFLNNYRPKKKKDFHIDFPNIVALVRSILRLGIVGEERCYYWKLFFWSLVRRPRLFSLAIVFSIYGHHFRKISNN